MAETTHGEEREGAGHGGEPVGKGGVLTGLSARLLVLTIFFVMLAEFLIWAPSVARYRKAYLEEHLSKAHLAMLAVESMPEARVSDDLQRQLLFYTDTYSIVLNKPDQRMLMVGESMPPPIDLVVDTTRESFFGWIGDAFETLAQGKNRVLRVMGPSPKNPQIGVEVLIDETPMRKAMIAYSWRILGLSLLISFITAGLVFASLQWLMVGPVRRITRAMAEFRAAPEDETRAIRATDRSDEIGTAQRELARMQDELRLALRQKDRLATLGAAVAKINHDLRNSLATAVLAYDRLADIDDPEVKRVTPRLYRAIDRAVTLCSQTLDYVSHTDLKLRREPFHLHELVAEVGAALRSPETAHASPCAPCAPAPPDEPVMDWVNRIPFEITVVADRNQLFRVFHNIGLNARLAGASTLAVSAAAQGGRVTIRIEDDGPGLPDKARERLFQPFAASSREGGTGLGLVIARDIVRAHGGDIELVDTGPEGTAFRLDVPGHRDSVAGDDGTGAVATAGEPGA